MPPPGQQPQKVEGPMRIYVGNLTERLSNITDNDLRELFEPFGEIDFVDIHRDPLTGRCKGYAFIQYKRKDDAKEAIAKMNNFKIQEIFLKVNTVNTTMNNMINQQQNTDGLGALDYDEDTSKKYIQENFGLLDTVIVFLV